MRRARVAIDGSIHWAAPAEDPAALVLDDGRVVAASQACWLAPLQRGATIFALGLNYADHSAELGFKPPAEPLVFMKGYNALSGDGATCRRPADAQQMHPECELVAVIGRSARRVSRAAALDYVAGYSVANDYAIREYLENYYRPNLRVKNRDGLTPLGPWLVDAADVGDPQCLELETRINGKVVQHGNTRDMIFSVAVLIEHLSHVMTLQAGDAILTGTPHGVSFVQPGDVVECVIERVGTLLNRVADDTAFSRGVA